jgi:hypothetical protein
MTLPAIQSALKRGGRQRNIAAVKTGAENRR